MMNGLKRKATASAKQPKKKQRKVARMSVMAEQDKDILKNIFSSVRTKERRVEASKNSYEILDNQTKVINKDSDEVLFDSHNNNNNDATDVTSNSTFSFPFFTDSDINELIHCSVFLDNPLGETIDDSSLIVRGASSTTEDITLAIRPISSSTAEIFDRSRHILCNDLEGPLDLSTKNSNLQNSNSNYEPSKACPTRTVDNVDMTPCRRYENPCAFAVSTSIDRRDTWMTDKEYSSTKNQRSSTTRLPFEPIMKKTVQFQNSPENLNERQSQKIAKSPVMFLEEILSLQSQRPKYVLQHSNGSLLKCGVWIKNQNGFGTGKSSEDARNSAASSLLQKLSVNYFGNIVGRLQEFCIARQWALPIYADVNRTYYAEGGKKDLVFIKTCSVQQYRELGQGRSKKIAKFYAAFKVWSKLMELNKNWS